MMMLMESCDCECKGVKNYTPVRIYNASGLSSLSYRVGTHGRFNAQMVSEIASEPALEKLTTRSDNDLSIALLDSWAAIADVLTFYQERIANEGFLRTATERRSVLELARSIGYELRPGVSASTYLAFKLDTSPTSPKEITIEAGTKVQSIPGKDEMPQVFETSADIQARQNWSEIKPQQKTKQDVTTALAKGEAIFEGTATRLRAGDGLLFVTGGGSPQAFRIAKEVEIDAENKQTIVTFEPLNISGLGTKTATISHSIHDDDGHAMIDSDSTFTGNDLNEILAATSWTESELEAKAELAGWSLDVIVDAINSLAKQEQETKDGIYTFRIKCGVFGHNAPMWNSLPPEMRFPYNFNRDSSVPVTPPYRKSWDDGRDVNKDSSDVEYDRKNGKLIYLDNTYSAILSESWIVLKDYNKSSVFNVKQTREDSLTEFSLTGKATGLILETLVMPSPAKIGDEFRTGQESLVHGIYTFARYTKGGIAHLPTIEEREIELELDENFPPIRSTNRGAVWRLAKILGNIEDYDFRKTTVYAQSDQLPLADIPVNEETVSGRNLVLEKMVGWLQEGQPLFVEGELADSPGTKKRELAFIKSVTHSMTTLLTTIELYSELAYSYKRDTVTINANVANATHGETKEETIGSGDPSQRFQSFELKQKPLTFVPDSSASGAKSTLEIKVDGVVWKEASSFEGLSKSDDAYVTRTANDSITSIIFGDGTNGRLPPSGFESIKARYRVGIGMGGLVDADKLTLLMKRPLGVKSVTNPLAATGAANPEELKDARRNAPRTVLTLDRIVSIKDYADFARGFAGVGKAAAYEVEYRGDRIVLVAIASANGDTVTDKDELYRKLKVAIDSYKDPTARFLLRSFNKMLFDIRTKVLVSEDREFEDVKADVKDALKKAFSFESRDFGQSVTLSEVFSVIQGVKGVKAVDIEYPNKHKPGLLISTNALPEGIIRAEAVEQEGAVVPSLLLVNEEGITVEEMPQ
jgi:uncharacterized phage protein gp47/JayE